jgi:hypothetical protein
VAEEVFVGWNTRFLYSMDDLGQVQVHLISSFLSAKWLNTTVSNTTDPSPHEAEVRFITRNTYVITN